MSKTINLIVGIALLSTLTSGCISVHKKESHEDVPVVEHEHHTVVVP